MSATNKSTSTPKPRNRGTPWDVKDIIKILQNTYNTIITNDDEFHFGYDIAKQGLPNQTLHRWVEKDEEVKELYNKIKNLSEQKMVSEMIKSKSKLNSIATMFILKCKFDYIEKDKDKSLNIQEQQVKNEAIKIKIGFVDEETGDDRSTNK